MLDPKTFSQRKRIYLYETSSFMSTKYFITFLLIVFMVQAPSEDLNAQVRSNTYNMMLRLLLSKSTPTVTIKEAQLQTDRTLFLDAREPAEYNVSHILNARSVGYDLFNVNSLGIADKTKAIIVYCTVGKRSENITKKLQDAGFTNVQNLYGGILEWVNQGLPVYDNQGKRTMKVHTYTKFWGKWLDKGEGVH